MEIFGLDLLDEAARKHADRRNWIATWLKVAQAAKWVDLHSIRQSYPKADQVKGFPHFIIFDSSTKWRLGTRIVFDLQVVEVLKFLHHDDYDRLDFSRL